MEKKELLEQMKQLEEFCQTVCQELWQNPETGGNEKFASDYLRKLLSEEGFVIINEEKLPYAFCAEYGSGKPVIAILGEYDALPELSQKVCAVKDPAEENGAGHGCGHNLLGAGSATAAVAVKRFLESENISGTVRFYGCPEEELLSGKVKMAYYHMFDGCDLALSWHPMCANMVYDSGYLASASVRFKFKGKTAHAAFAPERGRSALDAVELTSVGANYLREHVMDKARIHYTTDSGGFSPNIVPDRAGAWYYVRAPYMDDVKEIIRRLELVANGAAMMTETKVDMLVEYGCCEMNCNHAFADLTYANLNEVGEPSYTEEELQFAKELQDTLDDAMKAKEQKLYRTKEEAMSVGVSPRELWKDAALTGSSDSGDVSQMMPMNLMTTACWPVGAAPHTWQASASAGSSIGQKGAFYAAKVMAATACDLFTKPEITEAIIQEFREQDTGTYQPMYEER